MVLPDILIGVIKNTATSLWSWIERNIHKVTSFFLQWPTCPPWLPPVVQYTLLFCTGYSKGRAL